MNPITLTDALCTLLPVCDIITSISGNKGAGTVETVTTHIYWDYICTQDARRNERVHRSHSFTIEEFMFAGSEEPIARAYASGFVEGLTVDQRKALHAELELHRFTVSNKRRENG